MSSVLSASAVAGYWTLGLADIKQTRIALRHNL
jgi:hypothetical protein